MKKQQQEKQFVVLPRDTRPKDLRVPGSLEDAAREEDRKAVKLEEIERTNRQRIDASFGLCEPPPLPPVVKKRTAAEVEQERMEFLEIKHGLAPAPELPKSDRADESRPHGAPVNAESGMTMAEAMRLEQEGKLPMHKGRPVAVLTDEGWYTPKGIVPTPPSGALLSEEVKQVKRARSRARA